MENKKRQAGNVTIRDVAKRAGVSLGTVSRVLNDASNISPTLRMRVEEVIKQLGYEPNPVAQSLRSRNSRVIGVMLPDIQNPLTAAAVTGLEPVLLRAGYTLFLANTHWDRDRERDILEQFKRRQVDGVIAMVANDDDAETRAQLQNLAVPLVLLEREMDVDVDRVLTNQFEGTYRATRYLLGLGHRRIALITVPAITFSGRERIRGFKSAFEDVGLEAPQDLIYSGGRQHTDGRDAAYASLTIPTPASAIICSGGLLAGVIEAIRLLTLRVPSDLSLVTLGDTELAALIEPPVTAIKYDWIATGRCAAELLVMQLSEGRQRERRRIVVPHEFLIRGSCAPFLAPADTSA